jgi:hypothetical protein
MGGLPRRLRLCVQSGEISFVSWRKRDWILTADDTNKKYASVLLASRFHDGRKWAGWTSSYGQLAVVLQILR